MTRGGLKRASGLVSISLSSSAALSNAFSMRISLLTVALRTTAMRTVA
jgi:hypothetical protein